MNDEWTMESSELLNDFVGYCKAHPTERFWQALRNWSLCNFIFAADSRDTLHNLRDTFYWKNKSEP